MKRKSCIHIIFGPAFERWFAEHEDERLYILSFIVTTLSSDTVPEAAISIDDFITNGYQIPYKQFYITYIFPYQPEKHKTELPVLAVLALSKKMSDIHEDERGTLLARVRKMIVIWIGFFIRHIQRKKSSS